MYSTGVKPSSRRYSICSTRVANPGWPSIEISVNGKQYTLRCAVISLFSCRTVPLQRLRGFL